jgi:membrane protein implicated in regulation of membrane protease activity
MASTWYIVAAVFLALEVFRPGKFMVWLALAAMMVGFLASVARWPWPFQVLAMAAIAFAAIPVWRRYERSTSR